MGRKIRVSFPPQRIISAVPSQTELLYELGLESEVIGITKFCIHPHQWFQSKTRIGGTKALDIKKIKALQPDIIIANKEENQIEQIVELTSDFPVWISDIYNLEESIDMVECLGKLTNTTKRSKDISQQIKKQFSNLSSLNPHPISCAYFIWWNPLMVVGENTFINNMLKRCNFINVFENHYDKRYPVIRDTELMTANPEIIFLSSEPFPFTEKYKAHFKNLLPNSRVVLVNGEMFSWYGSRLLQASEYFQKIIQEVAYY